MSRQKYISVDRISDHSAFDLKNYLQPMTAFHLNGLHIGVTHKPHLVYFITEIPSAYRDSFENNNVLIIIPTEILGENIEGRIHNILAYIAADINTLLNLTDAEIAYVLL